MLRYDGLLRPLGYLPSRAYVDAGSKYFDFILDSEGDHL